MNQRLVLATFALAFIPFAQAQERWTLKSDDTRLTVSAAGDHLKIASLEGADQKPAWISEPVDVPLPDHLFVNGVSKAANWRFSETSESPDQGTATLRFVSDDSSLELLSIWVAHPRPGPVEHHFEIVNRTGRTIEVPLVESLALTLSAPAGHALESWWVEKGSGRPGDVGTHREPIKSDFVFKGRSSPYAEETEMIPWLAIQDVTANAGLYFGVEFSGRVGIDAQAVGNSTTLKVVAGLDPTDTAFRSRVADGETFVTPTVFIGCYQGDIDEGANRLHRFVEKRLRPPVSDKRYPLVVNNSWGSGMAVDEPLARHMIDDAASLGVEMFHIDAGWFRDVGDWHPNPNKFPNGLAPVSDYVHSKGMLFGLWVGWTQGGAEGKDLSTLAVANPVQRGWFTRDYPANWKPSDFTGAPVCLSSASAQVWCLNELRRIVTDYKLDLLEHDQIMIVAQCDRTNHGHTASPTDIAYHATRGYYEIYDQLRKEHPKLLFEDCVNGGRMVDFGVVQRTHYISITDSYDPLSNRRAFYDASYPLPPSMCECYIENRPGPTLTTFKTMLRSGMMGWCTLMCDTGAWTSEQHEAARRQIEIYKDWIRPLINHGNLYHISSRPDDARWDGMQYHDSKTGRGIVFVFRGAACPEAVQVFKLKGLDRNGAYEVRSEDGTILLTQTSGESLMKDGLRMKLGEPGASELIFLQAK
ncbi:alpha-galactosidase [bacterium]|nr:alpha-galactosidase [bacterium]